MRERVSQRERLSIEAIYHTVVTGNLRKAVDAYEVWGQAYPQALGPHTDLAVTYEKLGDQEKALQQMERAASLSSAVEDQANLAVSYMYCGRFSEAERILKRVVPDPEKAGSNVLPTLYGLAFANKDNAAMASLVRQSRGKAGAEDLMLFSQAITEYYFGRAAAGRDSVAQAIAAAHRDGEEEVALSYAFGAALSESEVGDRARAQAYLSASSRSTSPDMKVLEALVAARSGNISRAQKLSDELAKQRPSDTMLNEYWVPLIRASIELEKNHPAIVVDLLKPLASYDLSLSNPIVGPLYPAYVRGQALLRLGQGEAAAAEFEKLLSHRGLVQSSPLGSLAYLGKARALAMGGDTNASKAAYQQFLAIWKDADPGLKLRAEATAEYARLQ